jgi:hypothetical protein
MILTRTTPALRALVGDIFPDDTLLDPIASKVLLSENGHHLRLLGMTCCVIAHHNQQYVAFGYCPFCKRNVSYDVRSDYYDLDRKDLLRHFADWLKRGGNKIDHVESNKRNLVPLSNDCALFAVNNAIHF